MIPFEPHPEVWALVVGVAAAYVAGVRRHHQRTGERVAPMRIRSFVLGLVAMWIALDWPVDDVGDGSLLSVHMVQFLLLSVIAPLFLLRGCCPWLIERIVAVERVRAVAGVLRQPLIAVGVVSSVLIVSHIPEVVELYLTTDLIHLLMHAMWLASGFVLWWPLAAPASVAPVLSPLAQIAYLFVQSLAAIIPAAWLTFSATPIYPGYARSPKPAGMDAIIDQQLAGILMKLGGGLLLWIAIGVIFFRWARQEEAQMPPSRTVARATNRSATNSPD